MLATLLTTIDRTLYGWGFKVLEVRKIVAGQILFFLLSLLGLPFGRTFFFFSAGALLATINLLSLARMTQGLLFFQSGAIKVQIFSFYVRLFLTACVMYFFIVHVQAQIVPLLLGLSTIVANFLLWGAFKLLGKTSKEA